MHATIEAKYCEALRLALPPPRTDVGNLPATFLLSVSGEDFEGEDGTGSPSEAGGNISRTGSNSTAKRFRRVRRAVGGGAAGGRGSGSVGRCPPIFGPGGDSTLSFVFAGEGRKPGDGGGGGGGRVERNREAVHVSLGRE